MFRSLYILGAIAAGCPGGMTAQTATGDASRGAQLLRDRGCIICHKIDRQGGNAAPDLARRISRSYTPLSLTCVLWNHVPRWHATLKATRLNEEQAADLFAFFASRRYFEAPGDAGRGKLVFVGKRCAGCHSIAQPVSPEAKPIAAWRSLRDPIAFAQEMWNHPPATLRAMARQGIRRPRLTPQEANDLLVYLENLPATRGREFRFQLASAATGRVLFQTRGCVGCHQGRLALENRVSPLTMASFSASMWNHAVLPVERRPSLSYDDMSGLVSYVWSMQDQGDGRRGKRLCSTMKCAVCHAGPELAAEPPGPPIRTIAVPWNQGPAMLAEMRRRGLPWPRFAGSELADITAYLKTRSSTVRNEVSHGSAAGIDDFSRIRDYR